MEKQIKPDELEIYGKCWLKLKKSLKELTEFNKNRHSESDNKIYEMMLLFMKAEEDEIGIGE